MSPRLYFGRVSLDICHFLDSELVVLVWTCYFLDSELVVLVWTCYFLDFELDHHPLDIFASPTNNLFLRFPNLNYEATGEQTGLCIPYSSPNFWDK
ncbi:hypothetical protein DERF_006771 [Dermatophagoides farinae]|uniref:Uncharacterized protein n=1 Tax=Dermatophagoides farinae TaxID=6954 RepID=A0A922HWV2_DERFA|nr:hypothetical protein DERF_006771 [Dermatophagoides farinae]